MNSILNTLNSWDTDLFLAINDAHSSFWDFVMWWASDKYVWIPLYLLFLYLLWRDYRKRIWAVMLFAALLVFLSDQISVHLFKDIFQRLRPCHEPALAGMVHIVDGKCGGSFGFYSSHASNVFAVAVFVTSLYKRHCPSLYLGIFAWVSLVIYSRVYLGAHYPGDVIAGAVAGSFLGIIVARFVKNLLHNPAVPV